MTIKQLEYFMAVARTLSFSEAAKQLFVSQPALSRSIAALEEEMGVSLIHRDTHSVYLTPAGSVLVSSLPKLAKNLSQMVIEAQQADGGQKGRLLLGVLDGLVLPPPLLKAIEFFRANYKEVDIQPVCLDMDQAIRTIHDQDIDILFSYDTNHPFDYMMEELTLYDDRFCVAVSDSSPLAHLERTHLQNFYREKFYICGSESSVELHRWKDVCAALSFMPQFITVPNPGTQALCVENGFGIAILPEQHHIFTRPKVNRVRLVEDFPLRVNLKWNRFNANPCITMFLDVLKGIMAQENGTAEL